MSAETHSQIASFIWSICNLLRGPYKRNEYRKVILPLTVLRRFDCILAPTKAAVLKEHAAIKAKGENIIRHRLSQIAGVQFYNLSKLDLARLLDDPNQLAPNLNSYINGFSPNSRHIKNIFDERELMRSSVVAESATTAADGKTYQVEFYNLDVIISVGYRVKSQRGTQFRIWATQRLREYIVKGFTMDDARLKNPPGKGQVDYFDELLERIRDIRASERRVVAPSGLGN